MFSPKLIATAIASIAIASGSTYLGYAAANYYLPAAEESSATATEPLTAIAAPEPGEAVTIAATPELPAEIVVQTAAKADENGTVQIFRADRTCETLIPEAIAAPDNPEKAIEVAVGRAIEQSLGTDFPIAGYRVSRTQGIATIDLRLPPNAQRTFISLSQCEKFALFGSLRETLTSNPSWQIEDVRFTQAGEELYI